MMEPGFARRRRPMAEKNEKEKPVRIRRLYVKKGDTLKTLYAKARRAFTAADLAKYTDLDEPMVPMEQVIAELEAIQREGTEKPKRKKKKKD
jgi:hypothetical protein